MKVLWVHNFDKNKNKNSGVFMYDQLSELKNQGLDVEMYCLDRNSIYKIFKDFFKLRNIAGNYDLIHAQYGSFVGFFTSFLPGKKILSLRGTDYYGVPQINWKNKIFNFVSRFFTLNSVKRYNIIITMSNLMTEVLKLQFPTKNILTLTDGIILNNFKEKAPFKRLPGNTIKILFSSVNTDNPVKRGYLVKAAIERLKLKGYNIEMIPLTGVSHAEVPDFISKCDLVMLSSTHEGWPNIIKECLATNIPFVSTDVSDLKEIANVESTCFVTDADPEKLSDAVEAFLNIGIWDDMCLRKYVIHMDMPKFGKDLLFIYHNLKLMP